jgi:hypothetical protein
MRPIIWFMSSVMCAVSLQTTAEAANPKYDMDVVMVGIGAKNPTFHESRFPDLTIVYTPGLVLEKQTGGRGGVLAMLAVEELKGTPEVLATWWDETELHHHAILFDKNGVGAYEGKYYFETGMAEEDPFEDAFQQFCTKGKTTKYKASKEFNPKKDDPVLNRKMPEFDVVTVSGETKPISSFIENGRPTLVVFFRIPPDADLSVQEAKESFAGKTGREFMQAMASAGAAAEYEGIFVNLEKDIFRYDVVPVGRE